MWRFSLLNYTLVAIYEYFINNQDYYKSTSSRPFEILQYEWFIFSERFNADARFSLL